MAMGIRIVPLIPNLSNFCQVVRENCPPCYLHSDGKWRSCVIHADQASGVFANEASAKAALDDAHLRCALFEPESPCISRSDDGWFISVQIIFPGMYRYLHADGKWVKSVSPSGHYPTLEEAVRVLKANSK
jgi:hypothetical protein